MKLLLPTVGLAVIPILDAFRWFGFEIGVAFPCAGHDTEIEVRFRNVKLRPLELRTDFHAKPCA